jgi:hypothetical protein
MQPLRTALLHASLAAAALLWSGAAGATTMTSLSVDGQNDPGVVSADVDLEYDESTGTLTIDVTNTASLVAGYITGFAFNVPDAVTGVSTFSASGTGDDTEWDVLDPPGNAPGGYTFELGAGTGNNIAGGGTPSDGIDISDTGSFVFVLAGTNLNLLDVFDFLGEFAAGAGGPADFGVRFQALPTDAGSDFAVHVPEPHVMALLGLAGLALAGRRR